MLYTRRIRDEWRGHFDMLHDEKRNKAYAAWVQQLSEQNAGSALRDSEKILWCDIGTGSGYLGCLAAQYPANSVVSFETVPELASRARETICKNDRILNNVVWLTHTSQLEQDFMVFNFGRKATYVISELLDTCFLGEGLVEGMRHARRLLLTESTSAVGAAGGLGINVIPRFGRVYMQAWSGRALQDMHGYNASKLRRELGVICPASALNCCGPGSAATIHAAPLLADAAPISDIVSVYTFDMLHMDEGEDPSSKSGAKFDTVRAVGAMKQVQMHATSAGPVDAYVMWWEVGMDDFQDPPDKAEPCADTAGGERLRISTSPFDDSRSPPPDHWRQCVFFQNPSGGVSVSGPGQEWQVLCCCNESDMWLSGGCRAGSVDAAALSSVASDPVFESSPKKRRVAAGPVDSDRPAAVTRHVCECGHHSVNGCFRFKHLNSAPYFNYVKEAVATAIDATSRHGLINHVLVLGDSALLLAHLVKELSSPRWRPPSAGLCVSCVSSGGTAARCSADFLMANVTALQQTECSQSDCLGVGNGFCYHGYCVKTAVRFDIFAISDTEDSDSVASGECSANPKRDQLTDAHSIDDVKNILRGGVNSTVILDPYFSSIQNEWSLEHALTAWQVLAYVYAPHTDPMPLSHTVEIHMSLFCCEELWKHCVAPVGEVEGVDVSSMNQLLESCDGRNKIVDAVYLAQWGAALVGCVESSSHSAAATILGPINMSQHPKPGAAILWEGTGQLLLPEQLSDVVVLNRNSQSLSVSAIHGIAFWTRHIGAEGTATLDHSPLQSPECMQAVCCFERPYQVSNTTTVEHCSNTSGGNSANEENIVRVLRIQGRVDAEFEFTVAMISD